MTREGRADPELALLRLSVAEPSGLLLPASSPLPAPGAAAERWAQQRGEILRLEGRFPQEGTDLGLGWEIRAGGASEPPFSLLAPTC